MKDSGKEGIFVLMFLIRLENINSAEYNKVRIANSVIKSRIDKLMRILEKEFNTNFFLLVLVGYVKFAE